MHLPVLYLLAVSLAIVSSVTLRAEITDCQLSPDVNSNVKVTYSRRTSVKNKKLKIHMNEGRTFADILTSSCSDFPQFYIEYKEQGSENTAWTSVEVLKNARRGIPLNPSLKTGEVTLPEGHEINFCKAYDMRFVLNGDESAVFQFGPYYNVYDEDYINNKLPDDGEETLIVNYTEEGNTVTATWDFICARSLKIFLQEGNKEYENIANVSNIVANEFSNSIKFTTKPCTKYKLQVESYWTERPKDDDGSLYDAQDTPYIAAPDYQTFGNVQMDAITKQLSWDFTEYKGTDCAVNLEYKVTLVDLNGEELLMLQQSKQPMMSGKETLNIVAEIENKKGGQTLEKCHSYQIRMNISSKTAVKRVFTHIMMTNQDGDFNTKEDDEREIIVDDTNMITARIGSCMANTKLVIRDMENMSSKRAGKNFLLSSPTSSIVQIEDVKTSNKTFHLSDFKELKPCVSYSVQLVSKDQLDAGTTTEFGVSGNAVKLPRIDPVGTPTLKLRGNELSIVDDELNERCPVAKYVVKCWKEGGNETSGTESNHDSANISLKDIAGLTSQSQHICQSKIQYGHLSSQSRISSPWTGSLSVSFVESSSSGSSSVGTFIVLITFLNLVNLF